VDFERRPRASVPELLREDLSGPVLLLRAAGVADVTDLRWLSPPPPVALAAADGLLRRLGAIDSQNAITDVGRDLLRYPLSPRLAKVVAHGAALGVGREAARAAALLSERGIRTASARRERAREDGPSDVLALLDLLGEARQLGFDPQRLRRLGVDARAARAVDRVCSQLIRLLPKGGPKPSDPEKSLLTALLAGHPDRVAKRASREGDELILAGGGRARLAPESVARSVEWLVALDAADTRGRGAKVSVASAILPEWLLDLFPEELEERSEVTWSQKFERVESSWTLAYGQLVLESSAEDGEPELVSARLAKAALEAGPRAFCDKKLLDSFCRRVAFARGIDSTLPELGDVQIEDLLRSLCDGRRSFGELRKANLLAFVRGALNYEQGRRLEALAPEQVTLDGGRRCTVNYETRRDPWISSRLQDFFGMTTGPSIGAGSIPLVLHLLAPNKTAVSVTADLAGFWERHYPTESRRLSRRYPRHLWPDDPARANPPRPGRIR
jgi:ATP-dependent helicase HrpB